MSLSQGIEIARLVVEAAAVLWIVLKVMRSFATVEAQVKTMLENHLPHISRDLEALSQRIDSMILALVNRDQR